VTPSRGYRDRARLSDDRRTSDPLGLVTLEIPTMTDARKPESQLHRRQVLGVLAAAGLGTHLPAGSVRAAAQPSGGNGVRFLLGVDGWSLSFALGMRREFKPGKPLTAWDILGKVRQWGLKGAQVEVPAMPKLGTADFAAFQKAVADAGVVDLKAVLDVLRTRAPQDRPLHLNIESPQEYIPLKVFTAEFWRSHAEVTGREFGNVLRLAEKRNAPARDDDRIASMRGAPASVILAEEEAAVARSIAYCRDVLLRP